MVSEPGECKVGYGAAKCCGIVLFAAVSWNRAIRSDHTESKKKAASSALASNLNSSEAQPRTHPNITTQKRGTNSPRSANLPSSFTLSALFLPSSAENPAIVLANVSAWRAKRELGGMPLAYYKLGKEGLGEYCVISLFWWEGWV